MSQDINTRPCSMREKCWKMMIMMISSYPPRRVIISYLTSHGSLSCVFLVSPYEIVIIFHLLSLVSLMSSHNFFRSFVSVTPCCFYYPLYSSFQQLMQYFWYELFIRRNYWMNQLIQKNDSSNRLKKALKIIEVLLVDVFTKIESTE